VFWRFALLIVETFALWRGRVFNGRHTVHVGEPALDIASVGHAPIVPSYIVRMTGSGSGSRYGRGATYSITGRLPSKPLPEDDANRPAQPEPSELTTNGVGPWKGLLPTEPFYTIRCCSRTATRGTSSIATATGSSDDSRVWTSRHPFHVAIENWQHDLNIGFHRAQCQRVRCRHVHRRSPKRNKRGAAMIATSM
jgi:hypothetical protein